MDANFFVQWLRDVTGLRWDYQLAAEIGVSQGTLSGWRERGLPDHWQEYANIICDKYNVALPEGGDATLTDKDRDEILRLTMELADCKVKLADANAELKILKWQLESERAPRKGRSQKSG